MNGKGTKMKSRRKQLYIFLVRILLAYLAIVEHRVYIDNTISPSPTSSFTEILPEMCMHTRSSGLPNAQCSEPHLALPSNHIW